MASEDGPEPADLAALGKTEDQVMAELAAADAAYFDEPKAVAVRYDRTSGRFIVDLANDTTFIFPARLAQGLAGADPDLLAEVEIAPGGTCLRWEKLDNDFSIGGLLAGSFGGKTWMAHLRSELARQGGLTKTAAKSRASRENGRKGGRPRKSTSS
jgi:hypothetical protein